ncbi:MAG TPA: BACON domain-containing carbohydrate-binding protein, partial [Candidatus Limnocylindria bacterium]|nr:BACON domain-containing carbohydrate-binding protein [Candidatus Limnocylindria bacterium]
MTKLFHVLRCVGMLALALALASAGQGADRVLRAQDMSVTRGETNVLRLDLESFDGDENALRFSLCYDTNYLTLISVAVSSAMTNSFPNAAFSTDVSQAESDGRLGITLALDASLNQTWSAETNHIVDVWFLAVSGSGAATTTVSFCDAPIGREVFTNLTETVSAEYTNATVRIAAAPCVYAIAPLATNHLALSETGLVEVTVLDGCAWTAVSTYDWVTIDSGASGTGNGTVGYTLAANMNGSPRVAVLAIAEQEFTITQAGLDCTFVLSPTNGAHLFNAATTTVSIATQGACEWTVENTNDWIAIDLTNALGSSAVTYTITANTSIVARTASMIIAGAEFEVAQDGALCVYAIAPSNLVHVFDGATNFITLTTTDECEWLVLNTNDWITITSETNGTGGTNIDYIVSGNPLAQWRTGLVMVADQWLTIEQEPAPCVFVLSVTNATYEPGATNDSFFVSTPLDCPWTVAADSDWIAITSGLAPVGPGEVAYTVAANPIGVTRVGHIVAGGESFEITQQGVPCTFVVTPLEQTFSSASVTGIVEVVTSDGCAWIVATTNEWITILSAANNSSNGPVAYAVTNNNSLTERVGFISIADQVLVVTQQAVVCTYTIEPVGGSHAFGAATGLVNVTTSDVCPWEVANSNAWITLGPVTNGVGAGAFGYAVEANTTAVPREGVLLIAGQEFHITQFGADCTFELSATNA